MTKLHRNFTIIAAISLPFSIMGQQLPTGQIPSDGNTYYIYNVGQRAFIFVDNGIVCLSHNGSSATVSKAKSSSADRAEATATSNLFTIQTGTDFLTLAMDNSNGFGAPKEYSQWFFTSTPDNSNVSNAYRISCRTLEANAMANLYYSKSAQTITSTYNSTTGYTDAEWLFVSEDDYKKFVNTIELKETATTYTTPTLASGCEAEVHLYRKLTLNSWNSFCIPFAVDGVQLKEQFGDDMQVGEYTSFNNGNLGFTPVGSIEAGKPYLLRPTKICETDGYYTFSGITSFVDAPETVTHTDAASGDACTYTASFVSTTAPSRAYVLSKNKMYHLTSDMTMKGFRGYFHTASSTEEAKISGWTLNESTTSVNLDGCSSEKPAKNIYTVGGQLVVRQANDTQAVPNGTYIINGKKIIK